ncbi:MAG: tetratricopeptide repeat protein [Bacteroidetes bacterium]|nr:tetratricopeptide repeat protein [Bacteroidota bacterium]MDA1118980.1 tetratricopeptide repeat protein [Bacteroidota bacterium]
MSKLKITKPVILGFALLFMIACADQPKKESFTLGKIDFKVTANDEARTHFEKGVLLLHSFMYGDAALSFQEAQKADPAFALAYWGEAMTYNHPLWMEQDFEKAKESLERLEITKEGRLEKAGTKFEKDILTGAEILYGDGSKIERDDAYAAHMAKLYEKYPGNHEVAAFYALSLLGSVEQGRNYDVYGHGAKIAQGILKENPNHPGALHYLIHSYDDPDHASLALEAANNYSEVAPDAGHALHMPSHIYIALAMWDNVISSNIRSYTASLKIGGENAYSRWNLHAYHWLQYAYLQKNDIENARKIMDRMIPYMEANKESVSARYYAIEMLGVYLAETGDWKGPYSGQRVDTENLNVQSRVSQLFLDGFMAVNDANYERVGEIIKSMEEEISKASNQLITRGIAVCSGQSFAARPPGQDDLDISKVLVLELQALQAIQTNQSDAIIEELLTQATELEGAIPFMFGPPAIVIPSYEMYGRWLLQQGRYEDALEQFEKALEKGPGRRKALMGKLEAARGLNNPEIIQEIEKQLNI